MPAGAAKSPMGRRRNDSRPENGACSCQTQSDVVHDRGKHGRDQQRIFPLRGTCIHFIHVHPRRQLWRPHHTCKTHICRSARLVTRHEPLSEVVWRRRSLYLSTREPTVPATRRRQARIRTPSAERGISWLGCFTKPVDQPSPADSPALMSTSAMHHGEWGED